MDELTKRKQIRQYFDYGKKKPKIPYYLIGIGLLLLAFKATVLGILLIVGGGVWVYFMYQYSGPSDQQIDQWFQEDISRLVDKSIDKLGLEGEDIPGEPVIVFGPIFWQTNGIPSEDLLWRKGKDGIARFSVYRVTIIQLPKHHLSSYSCNFNLLKNAALNETMHEFHYKDVVSVSTREESTNYTLPSGMKLVSAQEFRISVSSGEHISVIVGSEKLKQITNAEIPTTSVEKAIQTIRTLLREKKQG